MHGCMHIQLERTLESICDFQFHILTSLKFTSALQYHIEEGKHIHHQLQAPPSPWLAFSTASHDRENFPLMKMETLWACCRSHRRPRQCLNTMLTKVLPLFILSEKFHYIGGDVKCLCVSIIKKLKYCAKSFHKSPTMK